MELSVVIPIYHTAKNAVLQLPEVITQLRHKFSKFEILFIIDNAKILQEVKGLYTLNEIYPEIKIQQLNKNYGQHFATLCGYYLAQGKYILCADEDMTQYVTEICRTEDYKKHDIFYWHYNKNNMYTSPVRKACSILFKALIHHIINFRKNSTFRVINQSLRNKIIKDRHVYWNIDMMIFNNTENIGGCTLDFFDVTDDNSSYNYKSLINVAFEIAYEHNTIFMNFVFALFPALLVSIWYPNLYIIAGVYISFVFLITGFFTLIKQLSLPTTSKIQRAIQQEQYSELLEPVTD